MATPLADARTAPAGTALVRFGNGVAPPPPAPALVLSGVSTTGVVGAPGGATVGNSGPGSAPWAASLDNGASVTPSSGTLASGGSVSLALNYVTGATHLLTLMNGSGGAVSGGSNSDGTSAITVSALATTATLALSSTTGTTGVATNGTVTLNGPAGAAGTVNFVGVGATFSPASLSWGLGESGAKSFTVSRAADGATNPVAITNTMGLSNAGATSYTSGASTSTGDLPTGTTLTAAVSGTHGFTIAQGFKQGAIGAGESLTGRQMNALTYWPDGSIKHALVSGLAALTAGVPAAFSMTIGGAAAGTPITTAALSAVTVAFDAGAFGAASFGPPEWASPAQIIAVGPVMSSWVYRKAIGADLHLVACLEVRAYVGGAIEKFPWVENCYLGVAGPTNKSATFSFSINGAVRFSQAIDIKHHTRIPLVNTSTGQGSARTFSHWVGTDPGVVPAHDGAYLSATRLISNLGEWGPPSGTVLDATQQNYTPNTLAGDDNATGAGGGAGSIVSEASVRYVTSSGDVRAWKAMMAHALSSGSWSHHYRDESTQRAFRFSDWPQIRLKETDTSQSVPLVPIGTGGEVSGTGSYGGPAMTHAPGYAYLPFLVTGRWWFLEELHFWATYAYGNINRVERGGAAGIHGTAQTRSRAWGMNALAQSATITPASHPLSSEFVSSWQSNTAHHRARYVDGTLDGGVWVSPQGFLGEYSSDSNSGYGFPADLLTDRDFWYAPGWMHNYQAAVLGYTSDIGILQSAQSLLDHVAVRNHAYKQQIQRAGTGLSGAYNWRRFIVYAYPIGSDKTGLPVDTHFTAAQSYAEMMTGFGLSGSLAATPGLSIKRSAAIGTGEDDLVPGVSSLAYGSSGLAALALAADHQVSGAREAYERLYGASNYVSAFQTYLADTTPSWAIKPRTPAYIASLAPFQARKLTGTYAPTNNKTTMVDVTPAEWLAGTPAGDPGNSDLGGVIAPWSGGAKGWDCIDVQGGGHGDSANNGNYRFDWRGDSKPTGWSVLGQSAVADVPPQVGVVEQYTDGRAPATHSYDGLITTRDGIIYRFGGGPWGSGGFTGRVYSLDPATGTWTRRADYDTNPFSLSSPTAVYDPTTHKVFVTLAGQLQAKFYDVAANTFSAFKAIGSALSGNTVMALDTKRGQALTISAGAARLLTLDFVAETVSVGAVLTGDIAALINRGLSIVGRDPVCDCYWALGGANGDAGWNRLYRIHAGTLAVTEHLLTGDAMTEQAQIGSFGRWAANWVWRAIAIVPAYNQPVSVIRLPAT